VTATISSQLDLILTNSPSYFQATAAIPCGISDHHYVLTHFYTHGVSQCPYHGVIFVCQYHKLDIILLDKSLLDESWFPVFDVDDIYICTEAFTIVLKDILDTLIPLCRLRVKRNSVPWNHSTELISARRRRDWLHRREMRSSEPSDWSSCR